MKSLAYLLLTSAALFSNHAFANAKQNAIDLAINKLSQSLKIKKETVELVSTRAVKWRNSGLGCPQANVQHRDIITPGYEIKLKIGNKHYSVHTSRNTAIVCDKPLPDTTMPPQFDPDV